MDRHRKESDLRVRGLGLAARFTLSMSLALTLVMLVTGLLIYKSSSQIAQSQQEATAVDAVHILSEWEALKRADAEEIELARKDGREPRLQAPGFFQQTDSMGREFDDDIRRFAVTYGSHERPGYLYQRYNKYRWPVATSLVVPQRLEETGEGLLGLIVGMTLAVILIGALVAFWVGNTVARPLEQLVDDVRQISRGDLRHRSRVRAGGELALLVRTIDRMADNLDSAQEAQLALSVRERELEVAGEVREALLPLATPMVPGYDVGAAHVASPQPGGDFHDYFELSDGRIGLLVCGVSGRGIPGALVGAIARSYLRVELSDEEQGIVPALLRVNELLAQDVRRGMFVTALYALVDPREGTALVACAGHKVPLIRYTAADGKIRLLQPEGIALGFDKGPVFERTLEILKVPIEPGDRLVLCNTGPLQVRSPEGEEMGEKAFYRLVMQSSGHPTQQMLKALKGALQRFTGDEPFPNDISIVTIAREG